MPAHTAMAGRCGAHIVGDRAPTLRCRVCFGPCLTTSRGCEEGQVTAQVEKYPDYPVNPVLFTHADYDGSMRNDSCRSLQLFNDQ